MATTQNTFGNFGQRAVGTNENAGGLAQRYDTGVSITGQNINVSEEERWMSGLGGGALVALGLKTGGVSGSLLALLGGSLLWRGVTGHCSLYQALGQNTAAGKHAGVEHGAGIKIEKSVTINKPAAELYQFWRKLENLPRVMSHLESVTTTGSQQSHWKAKAPAGMSVEWDAEIINEKENELIAWRSLSGAEIPNAGSVRFEQTPAGRGTQVKVALSYEPPAGQLGALLAKLFGEEPSQQVEEDLRRFKQLMETGETASVAGQPSGRKAATSGR